MKKEIEYTPTGFINPYYGCYGKMTVRNSMQGVLIQHEKDFYDHEKITLGKKVVKDICNRMRREYSPSLDAHYSSEDKSKFTKYLENEILESERHLRELNFAKTILSRKKVIFEKVTQ